MLLEPFALVWDDEDAEDEQRFLQLGMDAVGRILVVVFTYRDEEIRPIAAWKTNDKQRKRDMEYEPTLKKLGPRRPLIYD